MKDNSVLKALKAGGDFGKREIFFCTVVFLHLLAAYSVFSSGALSDNSLFFFYAAFLLVENYITVAVYCGITDSLAGRRFRPGAIFLEARLFFLKILFYKAMAGLFALVLLGFGHAIIELVKTASVFYAGIVMAITLAWLAFPAYLLGLTFFSPLIIVSEGCGAVPAIKRSVVFTKRFLDKILLLLLAVLPFWALAFFWLRMYNDLNAGLKIPVLFFAAALEVFTIKIFMFFYKDKAGF